MQIEYRIAAVPERKQYYEELRERLGEPESSVFVDAEKRGCIWNKFRILDSASLGTTHICLLDDDADVVNNFKKIVSLGVQRFPNAIWTFYTGRLNFKNRPAKTPYIELLNLNVKGIGCCIPVEYIESYKRFYRENLESIRIRGKPYPHDDAAWRIWALFHAVPVMSTIPNLVKDRELKSTVGHPITPSSDCWQGYDVDIEQFKALDFELVQDGRMWDSHLKASDPLAREIRARFSHYKAMRKGVSR